MINTSEIPAIVTVAGTIFSFLGITGIDPQVLNGAITGIISIITIATAVWSWWLHRKVVNQSNQ